jgi:hypothetical protein
MASRGKSEEQQKVKRKKDSGENSARKIHIQRTVKPGL